MNNEIKEILDNLKYTAKKHTIQILENGGKIEHCPQEIATELRLNTYSANILLDYITNLQEDYEKEHYLVDKLTRQLNDEYKNTEYQCKQKEVYKSKNEKAIEILEQDKASASFNTAERIALNILQGSDKE